MYFRVVICIVCFVTFPVLFVCICVLNNCHWLATQLQVNISYHISCYVESPFRWLRMTQSPYYTYILWKRNFILTQHTINTFVFHVKICFFLPRFLHLLCSRILHLNVQTCLVTAYLPPRVIRRDWRLSGLRAYWVTTYVLTLIQVLRSTDKNSCAISHDVQTQWCLFICNVQSGLLLGDSCIVKLALYHSMA